MCHSWESAESENRWTIPLEGPNPRETVAHVCWAVGKVRNGQAWGAWGPRGRSVGRRAASCRPPHGLALSAFLTNEAPRHPLLGDSHAYRVEWETLKAKRLPSACFVFF